MPDSAPPAPRARRFDIPGPRRQHSQAMRGLRWTLFLFCAPVLSAACGPYLSDEVRERHVYAVDVRCTQGPLEFRVPAFGARWGEGLIVGACSPRNLQGRYLVRLAGEDEYDGAYGSERRELGPPPPGSSSTSQTVNVATVEGPDNARCVASAEELAQAGTGTGVLVTPVAPDGSGGTAEEGAGGTGDAGGGTVGSAAPVVVLRELPDWAPPDREAVYACTYDQGKWWFPIVDPHWGNSDPGATALTVGAEILVRLWSVEPNDLEDVVFVMDHFVVQPSGTDDEWIANLREQELEREEEQSEEELRVAYCQSHLDDEDCWGDGGYDGYVARLNAPAFVPEPQPQNQGQVVPPPPPPPPPREPDGPPPALLAEVQPPSPSVHAGWVPGYWRWTGFEWFWLVGWWRVPEADVEQGLTTRAPEAPPPLQAEVSGPSPMAGAIWTPGYWQWGETAFVWVKGSWQIPPQPEAQWRPADWRIEASGAVFLPGGWTFRIGP